MVDKQMPVWSRRQMARVLSDAHKADDHVCTHECPLFLATPPMPRQADVYEEFLRNGRD